MLAFAIKYRAVVEKMCRDLRSLGDYELIDEEWELLKGLKKILKVSVQSLFIVVIYVT
jgi:hypothetical protein